jgi:hypothetical protein
VTLLSNLLIALGVGLVAVKLWPLTLLLAAVIYCCRTPTGRRW